MAITRRVRPSLARFLWRTTRRVCRSGETAWLVRRRGFSVTFTDIDARVPESEIADWQKQGLSIDRKPLLREMLQSMLADRCHLAFHRVPAQLDGWRLELAKSPPHLTEAKPDEQLPQGVRLGDGGILVPWQSRQAVVVRFYGATMAEFARHLSDTSKGHPVEDHTGLTGRYDFALSWVTDPEHPERDGLVSSDDPDPLSHWDLNALGLRLVPMKIPIDNLVIDHVERPSEN